MLSKTSAGLRLILMPSSRAVSIVSATNLDGTIMRRPAGYGLVANPRLVPIPSRPTAPAGMSDIKK